MDLLLPEYNISKEPGSPFLGLTHSKETLEKMSASKKGHKGATQPNSIKIKVLGACA